MIIKKASDLHFTYVRNTPELRDAFIAKCNEFGIGVFGLGGENYLEVYSDGYDEFEICGTDSLESQSKELTMSDLTDIPTETPEEKEVLDGIESAGEVEWNGEGLPPVGDIVTIRYNFDSKTVTHTGVVKYASSKYCILDDGDGGEFSYNMCDYIYEKPETPQQREDRERLEAAYALYTHVQSVREKLSCKFDWFSSSEMEETRLRFLAIVDKTNYRKDRTHDTN